MSLDRITDSGPTRSAAEVATCAGCGEDCAVKGDRSDARIVRSGSRHPVTFLHGIRGNQDRGVCRS
jgi:hypothetical protein